MLQAINCSQAKRSTLLMFYFERFPSQTHKHCFLIGLVLHDLSMHKPHFTQELLAQVAKLSDSDIKRVNENRGTQNKLGFAYQLCYVKLFNRLPAHGNFEPVEELATFVAVQLDITRELLPGYAAQKSTFFYHQEELCSYLHLEKFNENTEAIRVPPRFVRKVLIIN